MTADPTFPDGPGMAEPPAALAIRGLTKRFGTFVAVRGLDLTVPAGSCYGMVGPNGAGKTTTLAMSVGLLRPDAGVVEINGYDVWTDPRRGKASVGVLPDGYRLPGRFTGTELLGYLGALRGLDPATVRTRSADLLASMALDDAATTTIEDYSAGMTKKIGIAAAMLHNPPLLVLDEPFEAVDPVSAAAIRAILLRYVESGGTVVISSHSMLLVENICTHVAVVNAGAVAAAGTVDDVRAGGTLEDAFVRLVGARSADPEALAWLGR